MEVNGNTKMKNKKNTSMATCLDKEVSTLDLLKKRCSLTIWSCQWWQWQQPLKTLEAKTCCLGKWFKEVLLLFRWTWLLVQWSKWKLYLKNPPMFRRRVPNMNLQKESILLKLFFLNNSLRFQTVN